MFECRFGNTELMCCFVMVAEIMVWVSGRLQLKNLFPDVPVFCCSATADTRMIGTCHTAVGLKADCLYFRGEMSRFNIKISTEVLSHKE